MSSSFVLDISAQVSCPLSNGILAHYLRAVSRALFKVAISCLSAAGLSEYDGVDPTLLANIIQLLNAAPLGKQSQLARKANELWDLKNNWKSWHSNLEYVFPLWFSMLTGPEKYKQRQFETKVRAQASEFCSRFCAVTEKQLQKFPTRGRSMLLRWLSFRSHSPWRPTKMYNSSMTMQSTTDSASTTRYQARLPQPLSLPLIFQE